MDARQLLLDQHALIHGDAVAATYGKPIYDHVWARVTTEQMRDALPGHSSLAWLLWHMARSEDVGLNAVIRDRQQVLTAGGWARRLGIESTELGTGMSDDEAAHLSATVDLQALSDYRDAVGRETRAWLADADLDALDAIVDGPSRITSAGAFPERLLPVMQIAFRDHTGIWVLNRLAIWHNFYHLGEAFHVMQMLGVQTRG